MEDDYYSFTEFEREVFFDKTQKRKKERKKERKK